MKSIVLLATISLLISLSLCSTHSYLYQKMFLPKDIPTTQVPVRFLGGEIFSGLRSTLFVDFDRSISYNIIPDLERTCATDVDNDYPITGRMFSAMLSNQDKFYYYCPSKKSIYSLDSSKNFSTSGSVSFGSDIPAFNETKFYYRNQNDGIVYILGTVFYIMPYTDTNRVYNSSWLVLFDGNAGKIINATRIQGGQKDAITAMGIINNQVYVIEERIPSNNKFRKYITLYTGNIWDTTFKTQVETWIEEQNCFYPEIQVTPDKKWVVYSQNGYLIAINPSAGNKFNMSTYTVMNSLLIFRQGLKAYWMGPPFRVSSKVTLNPIVYTYNGSNVQKYQISASGWQLSASFPASIGASGPDRNLRRLFLFMDSLNKEEWAMTVVGTFYPTVNTINIDERQLVQVVPAKEVNVSSYALGSYNYFVADHGIFTVNQDWSYRSFQYLPHLAVYKDLAYRNLIWFIKNQQGNCSLVQFNATSNATQNYALASSNCYPNEKFYVVYDPIHDSPQVFVQPGSLNDEGITLEYL